MVSAKNKEIAKFLRSLVSNPPQVNTISGDDGLSVDIAVFEDFPEAGIRTYSTIGMSDIVFREEEGKEIDFRLEIVASDDLDNEVIPDILFEVYAHAKEHPDWICTPGSVLENVIEPWRPDSDMKHAYFTNSFFVEQLNEVKVFDNTKVIWVMMIPISDKELEYLDENGEDAFETMLEDAEANILDIDRESVL
jgi:hypothetical protein